MSGSDNNLPLPESVLLDDLRVSRDAAEFLAFYGRSAEGISNGFRYVFATMPAGQVDLKRHWEAVAARVAEMANTGGRRPN